MSRTESTKRAAVSALNAGACVGVLGALSFAVRAPFLIPPLAATTYLFVTAPASPASAPRNAVYGHLIAAETKKDLELKAAQAKYKSALVEGPVLRLPLRMKSYTFDPDAVVPLSGAGTVYLGCKFIDEWGILEVSDAALADTALESVRVPAPKSAGDATGAGWKRELNAGWKLVPGTRPGDFTVSRN